MATTSPPGTVPSLEEIRSSVRIPRRSWWRQFLAFSGPAFLISVGYMDPGNWGADLKAGSQFEYHLLWVLLMSNLMALLLQNLAARLGVVTGRDLAQACRESYPRATVFALWGLCEIAIAACDLAEVIGTIVALKLLFNIPYLLGLIIAACDTFALLALQRRGIRLLELLTLALIAVIGVSFIFEIVFCKPDWARVVIGLVPGMPTDYFREGVVVAIAMIGATVMPHNLYLHSALVQTRAIAPTPEGKRQACKYNFFDSLVALNGAFFINAAILVLAAAKFFEFKVVDDLGEAYQLLGSDNLWGVAMASVLFGVALLASGQSSTLTGTLAGQVVMEGFVHLRLRPWVRRMLTRSLALVPALIFIQLAGHENFLGAASQDSALMSLLVLSQVILSFQLPFAIIPLIQFTSDRERMGQFASSILVRVLAWLCAAVILAFNVFGLALQIGEWGENIENLGGNAAWFYVPCITVSVALAAFLGWVALYPLLTRRRERERAAALPTLTKVRYHTIGVAVEFADADHFVLTQAAELARIHDAELVLVHVVEGVGADFFGPETDSQESRSDRARMQELTEHLRQDGLQVKGVLGYGRPPEELVRLAREQHFDLLVVGTHGHRFLADMALGQTVSPVLHQLTIPVLVVPTR